MGYIDELHALEAELLTAQIKRDTVRQKYKDAQSVVNAINAEIIVIRKKTNIGYMPIRYKDVERMVKRMKRIDKMREEGGTFVAIGVELNISAGRTGQIFHTYRRLSAKYDLSTTESYLESRYGKEAGRLREHMTIKLENLT